MRKTSNNRIRTEIARCKIGKDTKERKTSQKTNNYRIRTGISRCQISSGTEKRNMKLGTSQFSSV